MTTRRELAPRYDAAAVEPAIYERWLAADAFRPADDPLPGAQPFVITQPPPNVTGALHLGHAATNDGRGHAHPLPPDARRRRALAPGRRSREHCCAVRPRRHGRGGGEPRVARPRPLHRADVAVHGRDARHHHEPAPPARCERRLEPAALHHGRGQRAAPSGSPSSASGMPASPIGAKRSSTWCPRCLTTISDLENIHEETAGRIWTIRYHLERPDGTPDPDAWISVADDAARDAARRHRRRRPSGR